MKKITLFVLMAVLLAVGASAIQISSPTIGGASQDRVSFTTTFTVTNDNTTNNLTGITFGFSSGAESTKYNLKVTGPSNLSAGASGTYTLNGTIPLDMPGVDSTTLTEQALKIGVMTVTGTLGSSSQSASADVNMQAANRLSINKVRVECDTKTQSVEDGDRVKSLKPGQTCTLEIEVENEFDDTDRNNQKIGEISFDTVNINLESSNNDLDVDDYDDLDSLDAGDKDSVTADVTIDQEADAGSATITLRVSGTDENGALHGEQLEFRMDVERTTHDVQITRIDLTPSYINNCEDSKVNLKALILNMGKRDEDSVSVEVSVADLKFTKRVDSIELDKDDSTSVSFDIPVAKGTKDGVLRFDVKTYFDSIAPSNAGSVELNIESCKEEPVVIDAPVVKPQTNQTTVVVPVQPAQGQVAAKKQSSFTDSGMYVALLATLSILIAGAIVALVFTLLRRKH